jgi:hypothetical protein
MIEKYSPYVLEAWAVYETLRSLGFPPDSIDWSTVMVATTQGVLPTLGIVLRQNDLEFSVSCSLPLTADDKKTLTAELHMFQQELVDGTLTDNELTSALHHTFVWANKARLVSLLLERGFVFPDVSPRSNPPPTTVH